MTLTLLDFTQLLAAYHCAFLAALLVPHPRLTGLTLLCATFSLHMTINLGVGLGFIGPAFDITSAFGLLYGPAFYLFVRGMTAESARWTGWTLLHAVPAVMIALWQPEPPIPYLFGFPSLAIYIGLSLLELRRHRRARADWRSDDLAISLDWVQAALTGFIALALLDIGREIIGLTTRGIPDDLALSAIVTGVVVLLTLMMIAARAHDQRRGALPAASLNGSPAAAGDDTASFADAFSRIERFLDEEEAWREPRLSVTDLARRLGLNPRDVSRAINIHGEMSFSRFINGYRIAALDRLLADPANHRRTIMELAYEAGFNSKSTFNRIYREATGKTPTDAFTAAKSGYSVPDRVSGRPIS